DTGRQGHRAVPRDRRSAEIVRAPARVGHSSSRRHVRRRDGGALMLLAFAAFVVVAGTVVGGYAALTYLPGLFASRRIGQRLLDVTAAPEGAADTSDRGDIVKAEGGGPLPDVDRLL